MTSYERIIFYSTKLPQEKDKITSQVSDNWPSDGRIEFDNVSFRYFIIDFILNVRFRYRPGLPFVLNDVCFSLNAHEKIGVCGRTGAGKSSLLFVLFRLIELNPV
jgi:ABC-type multidrug transport system fused ATPase/permease subunit